MEGQQFVARVRALLMEAGWPEDRATRVTEGAPDAMDEMFIDGHTPEMTAKAIMDNARLRKRMSLSERFMREQRKKDLAAQGGGS